MLAIFEGHLDVVQALLSSDAAVDQADKDGETALMYASNKGQLGVVKVLLKHEADPNRAANDGSTPLQASSKGGHTDVCRCLIKYGAKIDVGNNRPDGNDWNLFALSPSLSQNSVGSATPSSSGKHRALRRAVSGDSARPGAACI